MSKATYCNMCGKRLEFYDKQAGFSIHRDLGYGTKYDGDHLDLDLCCTCMEHIIDQCKITPLAALRDRAERTFEAVRDYMKQFYEEEDGE